MAQQLSPLRKVHGWALYPLVLLKEDKVTSVESPHPPLHSWTANDPSPALVHLPGLPENQQTVCVDISTRLASSTLPFLFEVARVPLFWALRGIVV